MSGLEIKNVTKSFDGNVVLRDINLEVKSGELLVVLGPSGCGKSTILRLVAGLDFPDAGQIFLDGKDITGLEPQKRKTAMVFQNYALYPHMTVFDNIAFPLRVSKTSKDNIKKAVAETATLLELDEFLNRRPAQLSGGQRQRVALGRGLIREPSIFLLDEPLSNLDAALRLKMRREIVALQKKIGVTMIYVTHDQTEALTMADKMVVIKDGIIHQQGTPAEIYERPADKFVASFIGTPPINLYEDRLSGGMGKKLPIKFGPDVKDGHYTIGIRPEHITLGGDSGIEGIVEAIEYIGSVSYLRVKTNSLTLTVTVDNHTWQLSPGQKVTLTIDPEKIYYFKE
ncbi:MAG: ABC transporter ATP-binding protein [Candidatus Zixiibacteriota bacterium]